MGTVSETTGDRALLCDVGGVLIMPDGRRIAAALAAAGVAVDPAACRDAFFRAGAEAFRTADPPAFWQGAEMAEAWARHAGVPPGRATASWKIVQRLDRAWDELNAEAPPVLRALRADGIRLAVVSNSDGTVDSELRRHGLREYFDFVADSQLVGSSKPAPEMALLAMAAIGCSPERTVLVGEDPHFDGGCARSAGVAEFLLYDRLDLYPDWRDGVRCRTLADVRRFLAGAA